MVALEDSEDRTGVLEDLADLGGVVDKLSAGAVQ